LCRSLSRRSFLSSIFQHLATARSPYIFPPLTNYQFSAHLITTKEKKKKADEAAKKKKQKEKDAAAKAKKTKISTPKAKSSSSTSSASKSKATDDDDEVKFVAERKPKVMSKFERLEEARKAYKWWEAPKLDNGINWKSLEHAGVNFPEAYEQHNVPLTYDTEDIKLNSEEEEIVTFYAGIADDGPQLGNPKTRVVFQKNFFDDLKEVLTDAHKVRL
jgi:actin-related protein